MDIGESSLPDSINPNNFPAKLWRLVNNQANEAICWDSQGKAIVINQRLFESQILSPCSISSDNADAFKTTNFSSFVRQLNLYGFRRVDAKDIHRSARDSGMYLHFHNPNFKQNHPELVASLRRLTVDNKAKLQAGLNVNCRPPSRYQRLSGGDVGKDKNVKRGSSSLFSPPYQESTHPYYSNKAQAKTAHNATPVPPRYLIRGHSAALSPAAFAMDKGIPVPLSHHFAAVNAGSSAMHIQRALMAHANHGNPNFTTFSPPNAQYLPDYYPACQCCQPNLMASHLKGSGLQTGPFSPHGYYQARYPVNLLCGGDHNQGPKKKETQEVKKCDINLDTIFQIADEVMQTPPSSSLVQVVTPEKPGPVLVPSSSSTYNTMLCDNAASTMQANPLFPGPIIMAISGNAHVVKHEPQEEESMLSVPEQMPEDAICEVTSHDAEDTEVTDVEVSDTFQVTSQADKSSWTGSTPNL